MPTLTHEQIKRQVEPYLSALAVAPSPETDSSGGGTSARRCRVCGCTDHDCRGCIERTGRPCYWVEQDLCSACE